MTVSDAGSGYSCSMIAVIYTAVALVAGSAVATAQPRDTLRLDMRQGSQVWIEGSSNVADWRCKAASFEARVELEPVGENRDETLATSLRAINVKVAVRDLKCGNRKMDHDLYAALDANDPARPSWILGRFDVLVDSSTNGSIETRGQLVVAGVERTVRVPVTTGRDGDGAMRARGAVRMLMTDFGIKPPVGLFGLIRSKNEITVRFDLVVPPRTVAQP
jgi:hypothetical protein